MEKFEDHLSSSDRNWGSEIQAFDYCGFEFIAVA